MTLLAVYAIIGRNTTEKYSNEYGQYFIATLAVLYILGFILAYFSNKTDEHLAKQIIKEMLFAGFIVIIFYLIG